MAIDEIDKSLEEFAKALSIVMSELEVNLLDVIGTAGAVGGKFDSAVLLNSQPAMIEALRDAGYFELAEQHIATYTQIPPVLKAEYIELGFPDVSFSTVDKVDLRSLAQMDLDEFNNIGINAVNTLRLNIVRNAVSNSPFSQMIKDVAAATVGIDGKGSPLSNYAYTHANTGILTFNGEVNIKAAESVGHDKGTDRWRVFGPNDGKTRDVCQDALSEPVRTRDEWETVGYFGGAPGGYNCRHRMRPVRD